MIAMQLKVERMPVIETNEMILRTDWNASIHMEENESRVKDIIKRFEGECEEISCHAGEKLFFLNREKNQNTNEAEFYIRTGNAHELDKTVKDIRNYIKSTYPAAKVDIEEVDNLFEQLFKDSDVPLIVYLSGESRSRHDQRFYRAYRFPDAGLKTRQTEYFRTNRGGNFTRPPGTLQSEPIFTN